MRSPAFALAFVFAVAFSGYAFADPQPLTRADCKKASMKWNDAAAHPRGLQEGQHEME